MKTTSTLREALLRASSLLAENGVEDGRHEAQLLLMHLLGWDKSRLLLDGAVSTFPAQQAGRWEEWLSRRVAGEPVQYIVGETEFYGLSFEVTPAVLIPRPETELLVEAVVKRVKELWHGGYNGLTVADIGSGSGAISVTLASMLADSRVLACDISPDALEVARRNALRNGVAVRMSFHLGDLLEPLLSESVTLSPSLSIDVLVSNPPYIESADIPGLQREVRDYEPHLALDGGPDGLRFYREIVRQAGLLPSPPRLIGFEVGQGQARDVKDMLVSAGYWQSFDIVADYSGIERHVLAWR